MPITRREMLGLISSSTFFLSVNPVGASETAEPEKLASLTFPQGVASGDPRPDAVMLWTRAVPTEPISKPTPLWVQVSTNEEFSDTVLEAQVATTADSDYTLRVYVDGLDANRWYYYRFVGGAGTASRTGRTRTAPAADQAQAVRLAFASCQSYEQAHYGAWARMLADDVNTPAADQIQFVLHLGDFIYERSWHKRVDGTDHARTVPPFPDGTDTEKNRYATTLADYRHLYKTYLTDPHLQAARARWPFICTWDDHEFANDNFQSYSTYHGEIRLEPERKMYSNQAWFEYIPAILDELAEQPAHNFREANLEGDSQAQNLAAQHSLCIYRKLNWGKYVDIVLTDTRSYRSAPCLEDGVTEELGLPMATVKLVEITDAGKAYNEGNPPETLPYADGAMENPARERAPGTLLGSAQQQWLLDNLEQSETSWKLWGNALPLIPMRLDMSTLPFTGYEDSIFNIDAWAGYPYEQGQIMQGLSDKGIAGVVSLSGDHHMHGAGTIRASASEPQQPAISVDFTVAGISSSPVFEDLRAAARDFPDFSPLVYHEAGESLEPVWNMSMLSGVLAAFTYNRTGMKGLAEWLGPNDANPGLNYVDTLTNGYGLATFDASDCQVAFIGMQDCRPAFSEPPEIRYRAAFTLPLWQPGDQPELAGPEFDGSPPFPF